MKEIMTPREAAEYLSVHVRTIYRLAKHGEIPGRKVGGSWRFIIQIIKDKIGISIRNNEEEKKGGVASRISTP
jgi:excisionase family DNA binding protein